MSFLEYFRASMEACRKKTLRYVEDLSETELAWRPRHDANPVVWILWHIGEYEESILWMYYKQPPIFRFKTSCLTCDWKKLPSGKAVLEYLDSARNAFFAFLDTLQEEQLTQTLETERFGSIQLRDLIALPLFHETYHQGQIAYIRRLMAKPVPDENEQHPHRR